MAALHETGNIIAKRYRILDTLGRGGCGITYKAEDLQSGQKVALKAVSLHHLQDWKQLDLFEREAKILKHLDHPAIPRYLDYFEVDTREDRVFYIVQQLVEGKSLATLVQEIGWRTNESGVRRIATQVLEILTYLHSLAPPVVHRDIKPQNLIWGENGKIFLVDFGAVADTYRSTFGKGSTIVGTYGYMAPEQFQGQAVPVTDLYGLGATVLFLLTHRNPADLPLERLKISFRSRIQVSEGFANWLEKMLEPDVKDRFSSAKEALKVLQTRKAVVRARKPVPWKFVAGVGIAAVIGATAFNTFQWAILGSLGFQPSVCRLVLPNVKKDTKPIRDYLKQGGNLNAVDFASGMPVLDCAITSGDKEIVEMLIAKGINVNTKTIIWGSTLLHDANSKEAAQLLIAKGANINAKDYQDKTPLHTVDTFEVAQLLIAKGADINAKDTEGRTPLHTVDTFEVAQLLISQGVNINAKDKFGKTPLHYAGSKDVAQLLIAKGANINAKDNKGMTPLDTIFEKTLLGWGWEDKQEDTYSLVAFLIAKAGQFNVNAEQRGYSQKTLLHGAAELGDRKLTELLIAKGIDVNSKDKEGKTALHYADSKEVVNLLVSKGLNINVKDNFGRTPLHQILSSFVSTTRYVYGDTEDRAKQLKQVIEQLIAMRADVNARDNEGKTPLSQMTGQIVGMPQWSNDSLKENTADIFEEMTKLLIANGANIDSQNNYGRTPLHQIVQATQIGQTAKETAKLFEDMTKVLIANGANVNIRNKFGETPLHYTGSKQMAKLLIAKGAYVNAKNEYGQTPLFRITSKEVAQVLIDKRADVNARDNYGRTPLHSASSKGIIELLIAKGADVNARDNSGETPLHNATNAPYLNSKIIELLIAKGADVNARDNSGETLLHNATKYSKTPIIELLIAKGADVNARDNYGRTPLHSASSKQVAQLLIAKGADINARDNYGRTPRTWTNLN